MRKPLLRGSSGFTLVEIIVSVGIVGALALFVAQGIAQLSYINGSVNVIRVLEEQTNGMRMALRSAKAWSQMQAIAGQTVGGVVANPELACMNQVDAAGRHVGDCSPSALGGTGVYRLTVTDGEVDSGGQPHVVSQTTDLTSGFTPSGAPCTGFVLPPGAPNSACPIRITSAWVPQCAGLAPGAACVNPEVMVRVDVYINSTEPRIASINVSKYSFRIYKGINPDSLQATCAAMGGTVAGTDCEISNVRSCASGFMSGFDAAGNPLCSPIAGAWTCRPPSRANNFEPQFLRGVSDDPLSAGNPICEPCH